MINKRKHSSKNNKSNKIVDDAISNFSKREESLLERKFEPSLIYKQAENLKKILESKNKSPVIAYAVCRITSRLFENQMSELDLKESLSLEKEANSLRYSQFKPEKIDEALQRISESFKEKPGTDFIENMAKDFFRDPFIDAVAEENKKLKEENKSQKEELFKSKNTCESLKALSEQQQETISQLNKEVLVLEHRIDEIIKQNKIL